jgi:hypothetical protein
MLDLVNDRLLVFSFFVFAFLYCWLHNVGGTTTLFTIVSIKLPLVIWWKTYAVVNWFIEMRSLQ